MVQLSFVEEIKDKASRLIPTAYMEIVEECTAPHLLIPTYEHVKFLCETVNKKSEAVVDVVRAVRRRITDNDVAVKHLTVQLLESMVKNSTTAFHVEVASQKGLLRDLVGVACMQPTTGRAMQAKEAALLLTLNLSIWFRGHPAEECFILTTLADDVRNQLGPNCFEGIEPERNTRMRVQVNNAAAARSHPRHDAQGTSGRSAVAGGRRPPSSSSQRHERRNVVDAIPINLPTPERVSAMLDVCMTFSEYLTNAEMNTERPLKEDEVVQSYLSQVKADHDYVTILLSSNLQIDRDVLRTVGDSQSAVLAKVEQSSTRPPAVPLQQTPVRSAGDTEDLFQQPPQPQQQHQTSPLAAQHATPPRAEMAAAAPAAGHSAPPSPPKAQAPSVDDLFGDAAAAAAASSVSSSNALSAEPAPAAPAPLAAPVAAPPPPPAAEASADSIAVASPSQSASASAAGAEDQQENASSGAAAPAEESPKLSREEREEGEEEAEASQEVAAPAAPPAAAPAAAPATAPAAEPPKDDDDFDAFLEGRM